MKSIDEFVKNYKPSSSKFKDIHEFIGRPQVESYLQADKQFRPDVIDHSRSFLAPQSSHISANAADSPVMKSIDEFVKNQPVKAKKKSGWNGVVDNPIGRGIGKGIKAVDVLSQDIAKYATPDAPMFTKDGKLDLNTTARQQFMKDNPQKTTGSKGLDKALNIAGVAGSFYTPGAGSANVAGLFGATEKGIASVAPNLVGNAAGRVIQKAATGAVTGIPLGVGGSLAQGQDDKQALEGGLYGAALGGLGGTLGGTVGELASQIKKDRLSATFDKMFPAYEQAAQNRNVREYSPNTQELTKAQPLGLPEPKSTIMQRELQKRRVLTPNTDVIHGKGEIFKAEPLGLPNGNYTAPTRLKVNNPTETLDYVMNKIKPQVMEIIEAPTRRDLLVKYIQKNTQVPISEIHNLPIETLTRLGQDVEDNLHKNMHQIAFDVAKQNGHDLPALLEGQAPSLRAQLAKDTQSQVYGVQPPKVGIQKPEFNVTHNADAAMPVTKIKRISELRQEVAATAEVRPKVEPIVTQSTTKPLDGLHLKLPDYLKEPIVRNNALAEKLGLADEIESLSRQRKTRKEIAQIISTKIPQGTDVNELVSSVRAFREIPSMDDKVEFEKWIKKISPTVEPLKGTVTKKETVVTPAAKVDVVGKPETLKTKVEVNRTFTPNQKVTGERGFAQTLNASDKTPQEFKDSLTSKYTSITNEDTVKAANKRVTKDIEEAASYVMGRSAPSAEKVATAARLIDEFNKGGNIRRAVDIASKISEELTKAGQTVQAAKIFNRLTPEGRLRILVSHAEENGKVVTEEHASKYMSLAQEMKESGLSIQRSTDVMDIFDKVKKGEKITPEDQATFDDLIKDVKSYVKGKDGSAPKIVKLSPKLEQKKIRDQVLEVLHEQEVKVLERMRARGNRLSSLPLDVYADYALLGSIKLAKGAVNFSKWSEQMIKDVGAEIKPHLAPIYEKAHRLLETTTNKITDVHVSSAEKVAEKFIKEGKISPKDEQLLRDLAKKVSGFSTDSSRNADMKMQQILNSYQKSDLGGKIATLRYIDMLLNTGTQMVNAISGPLMMTYNHMLDIISTPLDIAWSKISNTPRSTTFKQGPDLFDGMFDTVKDFFKGGKIGGKAGWQGVDPEGIATQHDIRGLSFKGKFNPLGAAERTLGAVSKAPDFATYYATKMGELRKQAYLDAINKGIKGKQAIRNYMDKYLSNPPTQALEQASRMGKKVTFQYTEGFAGKAARTARKVNELTGSKDLGLANAIVPFVRTPLNIAITGVENTPAGLIKGLYEINRLRNGAENITKREILKTLVSSTAGGTTVLGGLGYVLNDLGIVSGDYSSTDGDVQALEEAVGSGKFRFNTTAFGRMFEALIDGDVDKLKEVSQYRKGDKQFDYNKLQPLAFPFAAGATFSDQRQIAQIAKLRGEDYPMSKQIAEAGKSSLSSLFGMSSLQGLTNTFKTKPGSKGAEIPIQILQNIAEAFLKGFSPSGLAQEARRQDPVQRQTSYNQSIGEDVGSYFKSRFPGQSQSLQPLITNLGETKLNAPGITGQYLNPMKSQETQYNEAAQIVYDLITRTGNEKLAPTAMEKDIRGKNKEGISVTIKLTPVRYSQLQEDVGKQIAAKILAMPKYDSDQKMADKIEKIYADVREKERNKVKKELGIRVSN